MLVAFFSAYEPEQLSTKTALKIAGHRPKMSNAHLECQTLELAGIDTQCALRLNAS